VAQPWCVLEGKGRGPVDKTPVLGMAQRATTDTPGKVVVKKVDDAGAKSLMPHIKTRVLPESVVYTDEWRSYNNLGKMGYKHSRVHHKEKVYVSGDVHTNTIEGFDKVCSATQPVRASGLLMRFRKSLS
jgi:transposase-like protein